MDAVVIPHAQHSLAELVPLCDALATAYSTAAFDAMLLGKPVVTVNLTGRPERYPFAASGAAIEIASREEALAKLRAALLDAPTRTHMQQRQQEFLREHFGPLDGQAAARAAAILVELMHQPA